ncbi:MAG: alpha/beta hydrolase family protein [Candidatus Xenobiia bacterium LiM19]
MKESDLTGKLALLRVLCIAALLIFGSADIVCASGNRNTALLSRKIVACRDGVTVENCVYMSGSLKVKGLLFTPESEKRLPCIIFCHDGITGISHEHRMSSIRLAKAGYVVFSPSYRGEDGSEGTVEVAKGEVCDVLNALPILKGLETVDGDKIAVAGASHGALIAVLAASRSSELKAVVAAYGVMDIYEWWEYLRKSNRLGNDRVTRLTYGNGPEDQPESFAIRNAVTQVKGLSCPVLILQGEKDSIVPPLQGKALEEALRAQRTKCELRIYPHCAHGFLVYVPWLDDPTIDAMERKETEEAWRHMLWFFDEVLNAR